MKHQNFMKIIFLFTLALCSFAQPPPEDVDATTTYGTVRGKQIILDDGSVIDTYMGVPFAQAPMGELRFELPVEPDPWDDVFIADVPGNTCTQPGNAGSEDCLHANIYTPQRADPTELYPVMVWIHGGDYLYGANYEYPCYFLARENVVVVALNYRLGLLGFGYTGDGVVPGNMGIMDLVLGLQFVQNNIEAFGGDPNQVTIFGQSAGGSAVGQLMFAPAAVGLFHGAILQSGCEMSKWPTHWPDYQPENFIVDIAQQFSCPTDTSEAMVACLRGVNALALQSAQFTCPPGYECWGFRPVIDGTIIPDTYENLRATGQYIQVPEINGYNENDAHSFIDVGDIAINGLSRAEFNVYLWDKANQTSQIWQDPTRRDDVYEAFKFMYADWPYYDDPFRNREMLGKMITDDWYGYGADVQSKLHSADGNTVYYYVYDYVPEYTREWWPDYTWQGAYHGLELDFVFGWPQLTMPENQMAYDHSQRVWDAPYYPEDFAYADFMMVLWTNFAKTWNPTPVPLPSPNNTLISWTQFTPDQLNYLSMKGYPDMAIDYRQNFYAFWVEYLDYLIRGEPLTGFSDKKKLQELHNMLMSKSRDVPGYNGRSKIQHQRMK